MCDPVSIGMAGLSGTQQILSHKAQKDEAKRLNAENEAAYNANKQAAIDAAMFNESELSLRQSEEALAAAATVGDLDSAADASRSTAVVAAAEAGLSGNSLAAIISDIDSSTGKDKTRVRKNAEMRSDQIQREKVSVGVEAKNNINSFKRTTVRGPSILTPILGIASQGLSYADQYLDRKAKSGGGLTKTTKASKAPKEDEDEDYEEDKPDKEDKEDKSSEKDDKEKEDE